MSFFRFEVGYISIVTIKSYVRVTKLKVEEGVAVFQIIPAFCGRD
jgi:hypothetical protein